MSTIENKALADEIAANNGQYKDDPIVYAIIKYKNVFNGGVCYKLVYNLANIPEIIASPFVLYPEYYFRRK